MKRRPAIVALTLCLSGLVSAQSTPTTPSNFDPDSFGHNMIFLGNSGTGTVFFDRSCADPTLTAPPNQCVIVPSADPGGPTSFSFPDLGSITIPARSTKTIIWPVFILNTNYTLNNTNGSPLPGVFRTFFIFTIESDVLKDPSLIDPNSGLPYNGRLTTSFRNAYGERRLLASGEFDSKFLRAANTGLGGFSTSFLEDPGGQNLPAKVVRALFASPMTIRIGLEGNVRLIDPDSGSSIGVGLRLFGDRVDLTISQTQC
jgi:hypothetical protein